MSAISLKSITGITSITTPAGVDDVFTVHTNDTTERFRIDQTGNQNIVGIVTVTKDLDVDGHTNLDNVSIAGVTTGTTINATTFVGALTGTASGNPTLTSGANNRVVTATGANALTGEANFTYNGTQVDIAGTTDGVLNLDTTDSRGAFIRFGQGGSYHHMVGCADGLVAGPDKEDLGLRAKDNMVFCTNGASEKLRITSGGDIGIGNNSPNCKLAIKDTAEHTTYANVTPSVTACMLQLYNNPPNETANDHATMQFGVNGGSHNRVNTISAVAESAGNRKLAFTFCTDEAGSRTEKLRITGDGKIGIGTVSPDQNLELFKTSGTNLIKISTEANSTVGFEIEKTGSTTQTWRIADGQTVNGALEFYDVTDSRRVMGIDGSGRIIIGPGSHAGGSQLVIKGGGTNTYSTLGMFSNHTNPSDNTLLSQIRFGSNATAVGADIRVYADADWGSSNDYPTRMEFYTTPDGSNSRQLRLRISSTGRLAILNNNEDIDMDSSSSGQLQIDGNGYTGAITLNDEGMFLYHNSSTRYIGIGVNETEVGRFTTGGYEQRFSNTTQYSSTTGARKGIYVFNSGGQTNCYASLELGATNSSGYFGSTILNSIATADTNYSNHFAIQLRHAGNYNERFRINSQGECFIGASYHGYTNRSTDLSITGPYQDPGGVWTQVGIYSDDGQAAGKGGTIGFGGQDGSVPQQQFAAIKGAKSNSTSGNYGGYMSFYTRPDNAVSQERLRIDSNGDIMCYYYNSLFSQTGLRIYNDLSGGPQLAISRSSGKPMLLNRNTTDGTILELRRGWGAGGSIDVGTNSATYNTSSDYRLKENVVPISDAITRLKTLKPSRFNWIGDTSSTRDGFLAHEVTAVPEAITGTKDEVYSEDDPSINVKVGDPKYQGIDQAKLVPLLTAALQEAIARIEALEGS